MKARAALSLWISFWAIAGAWAWMGLAELGDLTATDAIVITLMDGVFVTVGALVVARVPRNAVGWILALSGWGAYAAGVLQQWVAVQAAAGDMGSGVRLVAWVGHWLWPVSVLLLVFLLLLFPTGSPLDGWYRIVHFSSIVGIGLFALAFMFKPGRLDVSDRFRIENPFGIDDLASIQSVAETAGVAVVSTGLLVGVFSLFVRARRAHGAETQQIKWFGFAAALLAAQFVLSPILENFLPVVSDLLFPVSLASIPVATGIAILRFHLYDIDVVINRTLVYGSLTAILAATYFGVVVILQQLLSGATSESDLAIAGSTLVVAALFGPLRSRVQSFIDHRFYRRKYDAAATLQTFAARLRDQVDLTTILDEITVVVGSTMQPAHTSVWLRGDIR